MNKISKIKGLVCLIVVIALISATVIVTANSEIKHKENESTIDIAIVTTESTKVIVTEEVEEVTEKMTEPETEEITEEPIEKSTMPPATEKPTKIVMAKPTEATEPEEIEESDIGEPLYSASTFKNMGVIYWNGWRWTWYSERILPGDALNIPGRHTDSNGYICDENDYICLASSSLSKGTIIETPLGKSGKVYDCGCASDVVDVYVNW